VIGWTQEELAQIDENDEIQIASRRDDGSLRPFITVWVVRAGDDLYVRSAYGPENGWYRRAKAAGIGRVRAGGVERDVAFEGPGPDVDQALHDAYHAKYDRYGPGNVRTVVSSEAALTTLRVVPR
jgi:hypothetical protein